MNDDQDLNAFWSPLVDAFPLESITQHDPMGGVNLSTYLSRPDMERDLRKLRNSLSPKRGIQKAVLVGQRGSGKSSVLRYLSDELKKTHQVLWLDAINERAEVLKDPLAYYVTIGLCALQSMQQNNIEPDRKLFEVFLSACLDTSVQQSETKNQDTFRFDTVAGIAVEILATGAKAASLVDPSLLVATIAVDWARKLLQPFKMEDQQNDTLLNTRTTPPQLDRAAGRLTTFIQNCEYRLGKPFVVILDGLDKVNEVEARSFYEKAREIVRPDIRMILTGPETLYTSMNFADIEEFLSPFVVFNIRLDEAARSGEKFLESLVRKRIELCGWQLEQICAADVLERLIAQSGGNIRTLINLVYEVFSAAETAEKTFVDMQDAQMAINHVQRAFLGKVDQENREILRKFLAQPGPRRYPPNGQIADQFLRNKYILMYPMEGGVQYMLHPLVQKHLQETS